MPYGDFTPCSPMSSRSSSSRPARVPPAALAHREEGPPRDSVGDEFDAVGCPRDKAPLLHHTVQDLGQPAMQGLVAVKLDPEVAERGRRTPLPEEVALQALV